MYSVGMADFTPEEVIQVIEGGRKCRGADLRDIDLRWADLFRADLRGAKYDTHTKFPEGFDPVAAGALLVEGPLGRSYTPRPA